MKRYILFIIMTGFFVFLQSSSLYSYFTVRGVSADFVLVSVCLAAFFLGPVPGEIIGFGAGLALDVISGGLIGISAFTYTLIGFGVGVAGEKVYSTRVLVSVAIILVATLAKALILGMLAALFLKPGYFGYFTHGRVFLEILLGCAIQPVLFFLITQIERRMAAQDAVHFNRYR